MYIARGEVNTGPIGTSKHLTNIMIDLLKSRKDLELDIQTLTPYLDSVTLALLGQIRTGGGRFGNSIQTFEKIIYEFMPTYKYGGTMCIGYRFTMENCKLLIPL